MAAEAVNPQMKVNTQQAAQSLFAKGSKRFPHQCFSLFYQFLCLFFYLE